MHELDDGKWQSVALELRRRLFLNGARPRAWPRRKQDQMVTPRQKLLVRSSWELMRPMASHVADLLYDRLFELDPLLEERFPEDPSLQRSRFLNAITAVMSTLDDIELLRPALLELGRRNGVQGIAPGDYATLAKALLWTFEQALAEDFTAPVQDAWAALYARLSSTVLQGAEVRDCINSRAPTQLAI
jgi:hemoglobin-like flavoprotein